PIPQIPFAWECKPTTFSLPPQLFRSFFSLFFSNSSLCPYLPLSKASANVNHLSVLRKPFCDFFEKK
ncbi:MAG: hypothetical protein ACOYOD_05805, partial [Saprospiraceae bacterium]